MDQKLLELYAAFAIRTGVNVQKNQTLIINCPLDAAYFGRLCAGEAYKAGARDVVVNYRDEQLNRLRMDKAGLDALEEVKPWRLRSYMDYLESEGGACVLTIAAEDPEIYMGLDTAKIEKANQAYSRAMQDYMNLMMANKMQWCILSIPTPAWAAKVFADVPPAEAMEKLWQAIFKVTRIGGGDPVAEWEAFGKQTRERVEKLNGMRLDALRLRSQNGTDLTLGLPQGYAFAGGVELTQGGVPFLANIPSEEVFAAPHRLRVEGVLKSSLPYVYNGNLIEGITATFEQGLVVKATASKGEELLNQLLSADEGARRLGEIALVPASSPIRQTGVLFYNTLFDENAACHIAFGKAFPGSIRGGDALSQDELLAKGLNDSLIHEDVMVGTPDMQITGLLKAGGTADIFVDGEWAF